MGAAHSSGLSTNTNKAVGTTKRSKHTSKSTKAKVRAANMRIASKGHTNEDVEFLDMLDEFKRIHEVKSKPERKKIKNNLKRQQSFQVASSRSSNGAQVDVLRGCKSESENHQ